MTRINPLGTGMAASLATLMLAVALGLAAPPSAAAHDNEGFIYGKVTTRGGNEYQGIIRWDDEEAFWDDLFHSYKESRPYEDYLEEHFEGHDYNSKEFRAQVRDMEHEGEDLEREMERLSEQLEKLAVRMEKTKSDNERMDLSEETTDLADELADLAMERAELARKTATMESEATGRGRSKGISILGGSINVNWNDWSGGTRIFISRFGDIDKIEVIGSEDAELTMRTGSKYIVSGYSNDVGGTVVVTDDTFGEVELNWKKIDMIQFMDTPKSVDPRAHRLHGTVEADGGTYTGFIQWDSQECLSIDKLDGDSEDGSLSIPMGNIRKIERRSRGSAWVEMKDGRRLQLEGSNDVDQSIRGIMVEDPRYGRCKIPWDAFDSVTFSDRGGSGQPYSSYKPTKLSGTVTNSDGETLKGQIVFDLDESEGWEMLNGDLFDIEWDIPMGNVKSLTPRSRNATEVELTTGESLRLEGGQDVSDSNDGVLVFTKGPKDEPTYVEWDRIDKIQFD